MPSSQVVVIDCRAHMLGRLASVIAKELLAGQKVVRQDARCGLGTMVLSLTAVALPPSRLSEGSSGAPPAFAIALRAATVSRRWPSALRRSPSPAALCAST